MVLFAQRHQVAVIQSDARIVQVLRRDVLPVMYLCRWLDQSFCQAKFTQSAFALQKRLPAFPPLSGCIKCLDSIIMMHTRTLLALYGVRPHSRAGDKTQPAPLHAMEDAKENTRLSLRVLLYTVSC